MKFAIKMFIYNFPLSLSLSEKIVFYVKVTIISFWDTNLFLLQKPPLKREDSFLKRFSSRQIPETQETVEDTGSEGGNTGEAHSLVRRRRRHRKQPRSVVNPDENFYFYWLLVLTVCVLYNLWTLIVRQSFPELQVSLSSIKQRIKSNFFNVFFVDNKKNFPARLIKYIITID